MEAYTTRQYIAISVASALWVVETWFLVDAAAYELSPAIVAIPVATAALAFLPMAFEAASGIVTRGAMLLAALFLAGHVAGSVIERTGGSLDAKIGQAKATGTARKLLEDEVAETRRRLAIAEAEVIRESRDRGCKSTCEGWKRAVRERQARIDQITSELADAPADVPGDSVASRISALSFGYVHAETASLWRPLMLPFGCLLAIWSLLGYGFRPSHVVPARSEAVSMPVNDNPPADSAPVDELPPVPDLSPTDRDRVLFWSDAFRAKHGRWPTQAELRNALELPKSTTWRLYHELGLAA